MTTGQPGLPRAHVAMRFVLLIGVVSFFADFTYESARSVLGPFLFTLQASAFAVGVITGLGELLGYGLRYFSGRLADRSGRFWPITIGGYVLQMASVPALALASSWQMAAALILLERVGKALRNPPRDAMLARAAEHLRGYGWTFGIHEACDQLGAVIGPLVIAFLLARGHSYRQAFLVLLIPAVFNLLMLAAARTAFPRPADLEIEHSTQPVAPPRASVFWVYFAGAACVGAGFADYPLIAYHFIQTGLVPSVWIAALYAVAMAVSGTSSLVFGRLFDRYGFRALALLTGVVALFAPLVFFGDFAAALVGAALWGMGIGVHESIIPAAVAPMVPAARRASAFGLFTAGYGVFWFLGSAVIGLLYTRSSASLVTFCVVVQLAALPLFLWVGRQARAAAQ